jgi:hypothetical protein
VADFIGAANVLPVWLDAAEPGAGALVHCRLAGHPLRAQLRIPHPRDAAACLVARPEDIVIHASAGGDQPLIPARIVRTQYLGFKTSYKAMITPTEGPGLPPINIDSYAGGGQDTHAAGSEVFLMFSPACSIVSAAA